MSSSTGSMPTGTSTSPCTSAWNANVSFGQGENAKVSTRPTLARTDGAGEVLPGHREVPRARPLALLERLLLRRADRVRPREQLDPAGSLEVHGRRDRVADVPADGRDPVPRHQDAEPVAQRL